MSNSLQTEIVLAGPICEMCPNILLFSFILFVSSVLM